MNIEKCLDTYKRTTIDGKICSKESRVGYCWCKLHRGYLIASLLREHKCIENNCRYFQKFEEAQYWQQKEKEKQKRKEQQKAKKEIEQFENNITIMAREMVKEMDSIYVINTQKEKNQNTYTVRYISTNNENNIATLQKRLSEKSNQKCQWALINASPEMKEALIQKYPKTISPSIK